MTGLEALLTSSSPGDLTPGSLALDATGARLVWSADGLWIQTASGGREPIDVRRASLQLSWSMHVGEPRGLAARLLLRAPQIEPWLHAELRGVGEVRWRSSAPVPPERVALLDDLPRLAVSDAHETELARLLEALGALRGHGVALAQQADPDEGAPPATASSLTPRRRPLGGVDRVLALSPFRQRVALYLLAASLVFVWPFGLRSEAIHLFDDIGADPVYTSARVTQVEATNSSENEHTVHEVCYRFQTADDTAHTDCSYTTGALPTVGELVDIVYRADDPTVGHIIGMRQAVFSAWAGLVLLFPVVALGFALWACAAGIRQRDLYVWGHLAEAEIASCQITGRDGDGDPQGYDLELVWHDTSGRSHRVRHRLTKFDPDGSSSRHVLYAPDHPDEVQLLENLPCHVRDDGQLALDARLSWVVPYVAGAATIAVMVEVIAAA